MLGSVHLVKEYTGSLTLKKDDIIFVRLVTVDDQSICVGMAPFIVLADYFIELLDLRDEMLQEGQLSPEILNEEAELLLLEYIDILWDAYVKPSNEIASNDNGELLQFCIVQFTLLCSAREAAYRLAPIYMRAPITETTATERVEEEEIGGAGVGGLVNIEKIKGASAEEIGREQNGAAQTIITFPWLKQVDNKYMNRLHTVLGFVRIRGNTLIVEVNSAERAKVAQELITQYLKDDAIFHSCIQAENADKITKGNQEESKLMQKSGFEVQGIVKEWAEQHWREWLDSPLPALQGKSPREAATTPEGRERLDALLSSFARMKKANPLLSAPLERLRKELGLV